MATNDIRIDRLENGVRLLDNGQKKILDRIDELSDRLDAMSARQDEMSDRLDELSARQDAMSDKLDKQAINLAQLAELTHKVLGELEVIKERLAPPPSKPMGFIKD